MRVDKTDGMLTFSFFWDDLTKETQKELNEALGLPEDSDGNNWTCCPFAMLDIQDDMQYGVYFERSMNNETDWRNDTRGERKGVAGCIYRPRPREKKENR